VRAESPLARIALLLLLVYIVIAPLSYGAITRGGTLVLELFAFTIFALVFAGTPNVGRLAGVKVTIAAIAAILALGILHLIPMPNALLSVLSPVSAAIYRDASTTLAAFGHAEPAARISIAPTETWDTLLLTAAYLALFVSSIILLRSRSLRRLFVIVFITSSLVHILAAAAMRSLFSTPEEASSGVRIHGAFINANHFAGYLEMTLAVAFGVLWREVLYYREGVRKAAGRGRRFEKIFIRISLRVVLWGTVAAGVGLTQSRAGILAAVLTTIVLLSIAPSHPRVAARRWSFATAGSGVVAAAIGFTILTARQQPIIRFLGSDPRDPASDLRLTLWTLSLKAWRNFPLFGSGLGTFREAFRRVQPRDLNYYVEFAHSDALQLLVTGGLAALLLGAIAFVALMAALLRRWHAEPRREESALLLAGFGAILSLTLHGLVEFNLSIPAIPATLACVAGLGWAAAHGNEEEQQRQDMRLVTTD